MTKTYFDREIKDALNTLLQLSGLSKQDFAQTCGIDATVLSNVIAGRRSLSFHVLVYAAFRLGYCLKVVYPAAYIEFEKI